MPAAGGGGERELLEGRAARCRRLCRADVASIRAARGASSPAIGWIPSSCPRRADQIAACLLYDPTRGRNGAGAADGERWRDIAGPVGPLEPGPRNAITDVPGVLVGHAQAASGERTGVTVVAPPSLPAARRARGRQRDRASSTGEARDRRARVDRDARCICAARTRSAPSPGGDLASGRGPGRRRDPGRRRVRRRRHGGLADGRRATTSTRALDGSRRRGRRGQRRSRHRDDLLRLPRRDRDRVAGRSATTTSACCCSATSATASAWTCSEPARAGRRPGAPRTARASRSARPTRRSAPQQLRRLALRPLLGLARDGLLRGRGLGRDRRSRSRPSADRAIDDEELNGYFAAAYEAAQEAVYNCLVAARPATRLDGTLQDGVPDRASSRGGSATRGLRGR